jgi:hypothetical protein
MGSALGLAAAAGAAVGVVVVVVVGVVVVVVVLGVVVVVEPGGSATVSDVAQGSVGAHVVAPGTVAAVVSCVPAGASAATAT